MESNFRRSIAAILKHEGGYVDHPSDPGGATNRGITHKTLAAWRGIKPFWGLPKSEIQNLTEAEAVLIYKANYWDEVNGDSLPFGVDYAVADFAVNSGVHRAAIFLQEIVGVAPDGRIGPLTLEAVAKWDSIKLIEALCARRMAFLKKLKTWPVFGKGWSARVSGVMKLAKDMAIAIALPGGPKPAPKPTPPTSAAPPRKTLMDLLKGLFIKQAINHVAHQLKDTPMNSNAWHNILNVVIWGLGLLTTVALYAGCSLLPDGSLDCTTSTIIPASWLPVVVALTTAAAFLKTIINVLRDGFGGLFKPQPPIR